MAESSNIILKFSLQSMDLGQIHLQREMFTALAF